MFDFSQLLVSVAHAQDAVATGPVSPPGGAAGGFASLMNFLPLFLIFAVFYLLVIRPQQKQLAQHDTMLKALRRGDRVVTGGGIVGTVHRIENDDYLIVEIADNVRVKVKRSTITSLEAKTEPVVANDGEASRSNSGSGKEAK